MTMISIDDPAELEPEILRQTLVCGVNEEQVIELLASGTSIGPSADGKGRTALGYAAMSGNATFVQLVLAAGAEVDLPDARGLTPLMLACVLPYADKPVNPACIQALVDAGANVNFQEEQKGVTALSLSAAFGKVEAVLALLAVGADVELRDDLGNTALHVACLSGQLACARALLAANADVNSKNAEGRSALELAEDPELITLIREAAIPVD